MDAPVQITLKAPSAVAGALLLAAAGAALASCDSSAAGPPAGCACFVFGCLADCSRVAAPQAVPPCVPPGVATLRLSWRAAPLLGLPAGALAGTPLLRRLEARAVPDLATVDERVFSSTPHLEFLQLTGSKVSQLLPDTFADNRNLSAVDLSDNQLEGIPGQLFSRNPLLARLQLSGNRIQSLEPDTFRANHLLQELDLSGNPLLGLPAALLWRCPRLRSLGLSGTRLSLLPRVALSGNAALESLDVSGCHLRALPTALLPDHGRLSRLDFSRNRLRAVPEKLLAATAGLRLLNVSRNEVQFLPAGALRSTPELQALDLSWNQLRALPRELLWWAPALRELYLAGNRISSIHPETLSGNPRLRLLDLSHNLLEEPPDDSALHHNAALRALDLSHNRLTRLCRRLLQPAWDSLQVLRLSGNSISALSWPSMRPRSLEALEMDGNPCGCSARSVRLFVPPKMPQIKIEGIITKPRAAKGKAKDSGISGEESNGTASAVATSGGSDAPGRQPGVSEGGETSRAEVSEGGVGGAGASPATPTAGGEGGGGARNAVSRTKRDGKKIVFCPYGTAFNAAGAESGATACKRNGTRRNTLKRSSTGLRASPEGGGVRGSKPHSGRRSSGVLASVPYNVTVWRHRRAALEDCPASCGGLHEAGCHSSASSVDSRATSVVAITTTFALATLCRQVV